MKTIITRRTRHLGFGWTTSPTGSGTEIAIPESPKYEGTIKQVMNQRALDSNLYALRSGGVFVRTCWFYRGKRILTIDDQQDTSGWGYFSFASLENGMLDKLVITTE